MLLVLLRTIFPHPNTYFICYSVDYLNLQLASKRTTNDEGRLAVSTQNSAFSKTLTTEQSVSEHKDATMLGSVLE